MSMQEDTLKTELKAMGLYDNEPDAVDAWADAWANYFEGDGVTEGAQSNGVYILPAAIPAAKTAMKAAMTGAGDPPTGGLSDTGAVAIQAGIVAFWTALIPNTAWPTTSLITAPLTLPGIAASLVTTFLANTTGQLSKDASMDAIAGILHTANVPAEASQGKATWPNPVGPKEIT